MADLVRYAYLGDFVKKDADQRMVWAVATGPREDLDHQACDPRWLAEALPKYMRRGNVRQMHSPGLVPAGKAKEMVANHEGDYIAGVKVVNDDAWKLVDEEVYSGLSIGVTNATVIPDVRFKNGLICGGDIIEISLVDHPAYQYSEIKGDRAALLKRAKELTDEGRLHPLCKLAALDVQPRSVEPMVVKYAAPSMIVPGKTTPEQAIELTSVLKGAGVDAAKQEGVASCDADLQSVPARATGDGVLHAEGPRAAAGPVDDLQGVPSLKGAGTLGGASTGGARASDAPEHAAGTWLDARGVPAPAADPAARVCDLQAAESGWAAALGGPLAQHGKAAGAGLHAVQLGAWVAGGNRGQAGGSGPLHINKKEYDAETRRQMAAAGKAMPDGSFPIEDEEDVANALAAHSRAKDPAAAAQHIQGRAQELGVGHMVPPGFMEAAAMQQPQAQGASGQPQAPGGGPPGAPPAPGQAPGPVPGQATGQPPLPGQEHPPGGDGKPQPPATAGMAGPTPGAEPPPKPGAQEGADGAPPPSVPPQGAAMPPVPPGAATAPPAAPHAAANVPPGFAEAHAAAHAAEDAAGAAKPTDGAAKPNPFAKKPPTPSDDGGQAGDPGKPTTADNRNPTEDGRPEAADAGMQVCPNCQGQGCPHCSMTGKVPVQGVAPAQGAAAPPQSQGSNPFGGFKAARAFIKLVDGGADPETAWAQVRKDFDTSSGMQPYNLGPGQDDDEDQPDDGDDDEADTSKAAGTDIADPKEQNHNPSLDAARSAITTLIKQELAEDEPELQCVQLLTDCWSSLERWVNYENAEHADGTATLPAMFLNAVAKAATTNTARTATTWLPPLLTVGRRLMGTETAQVTKDISSSTRAELLSIAQMQGIPQDIASRINGMLNLGSDSDSPAFNRGGSGDTSAPAKSDFQGSGGKLGDPTNPSAPPTIGLDFSGSRPDGSSMPTDADSTAYDRGGSGNQGDIKVNPPPQQGSSKAADADLQKMVADAVAAALPAVLAEVMKATASKDSVVKVAGAMETMDQVVVQKIAEVRAELEADAQDRITKATSAVMEELERVKKTARAGGPIAAEGLTAVNKSFAGNPPPGEGNAEVPELAKALAEAMLPAGMDPRAQIAAQQRVRQLTMGATRDQTQDAYMATHDKR